MESLCGQLQGRFKRGGQFWTEPGRRRLMALEVARRNHDWNEVWQRNQERCPDARSEPRGNRVIILPWPLKLCIARTHCRGWWLWLFLFRSRKNSGMG